MIAHIPGVRQPATSTRLNLLHRGQNAHAHRPNDLLRHPNVVQTALVVVGVISKRRLLTQHGSVGGLQREQSVAGGQSETADEMQRVVGDVGMVRASVSNELISASHPPLSPTPPTTARC